MVNKANLNLIGDIMLGERFEKLNRGVLTKINSGINPFEYCGPDLLSSDINIANLECVVSKDSNKPYPFSKFMIINPDKLELLVKNNIKIVNIANNHIFDHGEKAFFDTRENLEKYNISYFGFDNDKGIQKEPLKVNLKNKSVAVYGYDLSNFSTEQFEKRVSEIIEIISTINGVFDLTILSLHWGYEYSDSPTSFMIKAAEKFFDNSVDILYGHHPHILHGVATFNGKIFAPSLGNFIFDDERERNRQTGILKIAVDEDNKLSYNFSSYLCNEKYQPVFVPDIKYKFEELSQHLEENITKTGNGDYSFDDKVLNDSKNGHLRNMKRVRKEILKNFHRYIPFIPQIIKSKVIDKRIKKYFS